MAVSARRFVVCLALVGALFLAYQTISGRLACAWGVSHLARFDKHGLGDSRNILKQPRSFRGLSLELSQTISWCCFGTQNIFAFLSIFVVLLLGLLPRPFLGCLGVPDHFWAVWVYLSKIFWDCVFLGLILELSQTISWGCFRLSKTISGLFWCCFGLSQTIFGLSHQTILGVFISGLFGAWLLSGGAGTWKQHQIV